MTRLLLFITGSTDLSRQALAVVGPLRGLGYEVEVIDVTQSPGLAETYHVLATPALVRDQPAPRKRVIGTLADVAAILNALDLQPPDRPLRVSPRGPGTGGPAA